MAPRRLIIVHGDRQSTDALAASCKRSIPSCGAAGVKAPRAGERIGLDSDTSLIRVQMRSQLFDGLQFQVRTTRTQLEFGVLEHNR
jgi:hypothetical protein